MTFGFYRRRLKSTIGWGNTHSIRNSTHKCGCSTDHIFLADFSNKEERNRTVVIRPCLKHTGKFFKTRWR